MVFSKFFCSATLVILFVNSSITINTADAAPSPKMTHRRQLTLFDLPHITDANDFTSYRTVADPDPTIGVDQEQQKSTSPSTRSRVLSSISQGSSQFYPYTPSFTQESGTRPDHIQIDVAAEEEEEVLHAHHCSPDNLFGINVPVPPTDQGKESPTRSIFAHLNQPHNSGIHSSILYPERLLGSWHSPRILLNFSWKRTSPEDDNQ